jgi:hypothetical protein
MPKKYTIEEMREKVRMYPYNNQSASEFLSWLEQ